jgi:LPS O-antigen subunit length determinant protein (WzzB/FepE family)
MKRLLSNWKKIIFYSFGSIIALCGLAILLAFGTLFVMEDDYYDKVEAAEPTKQVEKKVENNETSSTHKTSTLEELTVEKTEYATENQFVADLHSHFNDLTGWGAVESLDMEQADHWARSVVVYTKYFIDNGMESKSLEEDFKTMRELGLKVAKQQDKEAAIQLHRYLHDLDKALNNYQHEDTFGVTKTLAEK